MRPSPQWMISWPSFRWSTLPRRKTVEVYLLAGLRGETIDISTVTKPVMETLSRFSTREVLCIDTMIALMSSASRCPLYNDMEFKSIVMQTRSGQR